MVKHLTHSILLVLSIIILSGCEGLPDNLVEEIEKMPGTQDRLERFIDKRKIELTDLSSHKEASFLQRYSKNENWSQYFTNAFSQLEQAKNLYNNKIISFYDKDDPKDAADVVKLNRQFKDLLAMSTTSARHTNERIAFLIESRDNASAIHSKAKQQLFEINRLRDELSTNIQKAVLDYPNKKEDLNTRQALLDKLAKSSVSSGSQLNTEYDKRIASSIGFVDYAKIGDQAKAIEKNLVDATKQQKEATKKIKQLYQSYVKVLADQHIEYYLVIRRATWCEGEYCGNGSELNYKPIKVDATVFEYFDALQVSTIASIRKSWGSENLEINIKKDIWKTLSLNEKYRWDRNHTHADYWVQKMYTQSFHKYVEINNDQSKETDWNSVNEKFYWQQYDNLGMAIITKPYGFYDEDAITDAQPVGMATIAKPTGKDGVANGSNQYGEWRHSNGHSFWHYYGMYHMFGSLIGPSRYGYNDWNGYSSRRRGSSYYGRDNRWGTFGRSTYSNSRYQNSGFARENSRAVFSARTGKPTTGSRSIRGASSSSRNRGPSSRGK